MVDRRFSLFDTSLKVRSHLVDRTETVQKGIAENTKVCRSRVVLPINRNLFKPANLKTNLCPQEFVDVLEDAQQELAPFLALLLGLLLQSETLLLGLGKDRLELFEPFAKLLSIALMLA